MLSECSLDCSLNPSLHIKLCDKVDGNWSDWAQWSSCSNTCGKGTISRSRNCDDPAPAFGGQGCGGSNTEMEECNTRKRKPGIKEEL